MINDWVRAFRGEPNCPKCGASADQVLTEWHTSIVFGFCDAIYDTTLALTDTPDTISDPCTEHLCRACQRCSFLWCERTADHCEG